jgi:hypothetical protein
VAIKPHECKPGCYHGTESISETVSAYPSGLDELVPVTNEDGGYSPEFLSALQGSPECNCGNRHKQNYLQHGRYRHPNLPPCPYGEWLKERDEWE